MTDNNTESNALIPQASEDEEALSMTLSGIGRGGSGPIDGELPSPEPQSGGILSHTTLLVVIVAVIAAGSLYLMRATQGSLTSSKDVEDIEAKIANALNKLNKPALLTDGDPLQAENLAALFSPTDEATAIFEHDVREQQVPIEQIKKDPFSLTFADESQTTAQQDTTHNNDRRFAKLKDELDKFDLQSIMLGARNIAVIGGEFYKKGDRLGSFTITDIDKFTVYLQAAGASFELTLQDQGR
ncbi:MAG: hypothetical protein Kow00105_08980 [Phycisphaeraceae bacterium]